MKSRQTALKEYLLDIQVNIHNKYFFVDRFEDHFIISKNSNSKIMYKTQYLQLSIVLLKSD